MTFEHDNNFGSLFKNDKEGNEKWPDYKGKCTVNGEKMYMAAWIKEGKKGKFMSIEFSEPREKQEAKPEPAPPSPELDDEIPF